MVRSGGRVLVTGATGFLGRALSARLVEDRIGVSALVRDPSSLDSLGRAADQIQVYRGDLHDEEVIEQSLKGVDLVYHLAGKVYDEGDAHLEREYASVNVDGTRNLLRACATAGVRRLVFASSVLAIGVGEEKVLTEQDPCRPTTNYGRSKRAGEELVEEYGRNGGETTIVRFATIYGEGANDPILKLAGPIKRYRSPLIGNGENRRSMVYLGNAVDALVSLRNSQLGSGETYIVTDGEDYSQRELFDAIALFLGLSRSRLSVPVWAGYALGWGCEIAARGLGVSAPISREKVRRLIANARYSSSKLSRVLRDWPRFTVKEALKRTLDYHVAAGYL